MTNTVDGTVGDTPSGPLENPDAGKPIGHAIVRCMQCNGPLWRRAGECRLCWLKFKDDDRNHSIAQRFWGRRKEGAEFSNFFDWAGLIALGIFRVGMRAAVGTKAEANSTENSPATNYWLPRFSAPACELRFGTTDEQKYASWLTLRAFTPSGMNELLRGADLKIRLR